MRIQIQYKIYNTDQMQALRQQKQQYLRQKILDSSYDPNEFMDYCESTIGSVDIDAWTFDQLVKIVQDFINSKTVPEQYNQSVIANTNAHVGLDQFDDWVNATSTQHVQPVFTIPPKVQQPKFQLNLFDLDFLEVLGKPGTNAKPNTTTTTNNNNVANTQKNTKIETKTQINPGFMNVPSDIAKKLQQGNQNFIIGYNPATIPVPQQQTMHINQSSYKIEQKQTANYNSNNNIPSYPSASSVSPSSVNSHYNSITISQTNSQNFSKILTCKKLINKSRLIGNEDVVISGHEIINPNIFVPKYVLYFVTVNPNNIEVKRRLKDFQNLRQLLQKFFPTTQIPHLQRCSRLSQTEPASIKKQILFLQSFLNSLLMKKQLRCKLLQQFLLCKDLDLLKKIFKEYQKLSGPRALQGLFSPSGELQIKMSPQNRRYVNQNITLNQFMKDHFSKIKGLYDTLMESFDKNVNTLTQIQQMHRIFKQKIKSVNKQFTPEYQCPQLQKSLQRVQMMHKQWASSFKTQVRIIQSELRHLYRYQQDNIDTVRQQIKFQQQIAAAYAKRSDKDQAGRQAYQSKKLQQFKMTLQSPSKNITVLKHQAGYMQQKISQQCLNYLSQLSSKMDHKYKLFCTLQFSICQDMESVWKNFQQYYK